MELRQFNIREADWQADGKMLSNIRRLVFIVEQNVPQDEEWDGRDEDAWHWLATDESEAPIGTCRLLPDGQIGRMAVVSEHRGAGIGAALLEAAVEKARHLGMPDVFLHAQTHALGFYEQLGFTAHGDEFMDAGIPHLHMTQVLAPPEDNVQRLTSVDSQLEISVKSFDTREIDWYQNEGALRRVRRRVFTTEMGLPVTLEVDELDTECIHWAAENSDGHIIGCLRMTKDGAISRVAVIDDYRGHGIGYSLVELAVQRAKRFALNHVRLDAQSAAVEFYRKLGFRPEGEPFEEAGITHQPMIFEVSLIDEEAQTVPHGEALGTDVGYRLGHDKQLILLRGESDFKNVVLDMTRQAKHSIRIYSPLLAHELYDDSQLRETCSRLARRNKYTKVEILVFDPHRVIKNGHVLLNIARKLPSSIGIKVVDPEMRQLNHEFLIVDGEGYIYRQEYDKFEGTACFMDITEANRLGRQFTAAWESGLLDPNLRQLRI